VAVGPGLIKKAIAPGKFLFLRAGKRGGSRIFKNNCLLILIENNF
jgi:hypothetical protein